MSDKDLGEGLEKLDEEIETLKNTEFRLFGIKMTAVTISAALAVISSGIGTLYGGFLVYKDYMDMKEIIANIDVAEIESRNQLIETKLDEAIEYTRDIKSGLRDDILQIEKQADRVEDMVRESEERVRQMIDSANIRFENKRDALQNDYDRRASQLRESNDTKIKELEERMNAKIQRALDNPLAN
jgi:hypothetical protein